MTIVDRLMATICESLCQHQTAALIVNLTTRIWQLESEIEQLKNKKRRKKLDPNSATPPWEQKSG